MLATLLLIRKLQHMGHKWVICGSHPDCSVGQWVKWVNRYDLLSTLIKTISSQGYLEHCHPILNHDIAVTMTLIAIAGNRINI